MQHDKGNASIVKPIIVSTKPGDDIVESIFEATNTTHFVSSMITD